ADDRRAHLRRAVRRHGDRRRRPPVVGRLHQLPLASRGPGRDSFGLGGLDAGDAHDRVLRRAARRRRRRLSRGVRGEELGHRPDRDQHHQPRGRAVDRLRPARARTVRLSVRPWPVDPVGGADARAAHPAGGDRRHARGDPLHPAGHPRGLLRARRHAVADRALPHPAVLLGRHPHRHHHRHGARDRRDRADHHHRRAHLHRLPAARAGQGRAAVHLLRMAAVAVLGGAHPDVQLNLAAGGGVPRQRRGRRLRAGSDDSRYEWTRHMAAVSLATQHQVVMSAPETHMMEVLATKAEARSLSFYYGDFRALQGISMTVHERKVTALIGPSGCGKSTFLRCFNRMHDLYPGNRYEGEILLQPDNTNLLAPGVDPIEVRMRIGMVFQKPNPFPKTVFENVAYGLRVRGEGSRRRIEEKVEQALQDAALWEEVKDRLHQPAYNLSGGQQQRLCIARALATDPELLLFDEPTSALDPIATASIEELMHDLKERVTILIVTHNMQQAARVSDFTAYMYLGDLIEFGVTDELFIKPRMKQTEDYITGRFG